MKKKIRNLVNFLKIGIIGGTGPQGKGIALRLAKAGYEVVIGSRTLEKANSIIDELRSMGNFDNITGRTNLDVISEVKIIFVTIPYETVQSTLEPLLDLIKKNITILVDITVPMKFVKGSGMVFDSPEHGTMSKFLTKLVEPVPVVGALKTISAHALMDINSPLNLDTFVFGPKEYRKEIIELISKVETLRPIDAGPISAAETVERLVPFLININRRYKVKDSGIKIVM
jgi:hypothetical protein